MNDFQVILRLLAATVAGAVIGFERELHDKPAGLRTNILICLGAALFTLLSDELVGAGVSDPTRIAAQVVTGVGFLGAGAIVQFKGNVLGLTTAATIWTVASVGMAFGGGQFFIGTVATVLTAGVLFGLSVLEKWIVEWRVTERFRLLVDPTSEAAEEIRQLIRSRNVYLRSWTILEYDDNLSVRIELTGPVGRIRELQTALSA